MNLLLGVTGSVAAIKLLDIIHFLNLGAKELSINLNIRIVVTQRALHFLQPITDFDPITVYTDDDEWEQWKTKGDPVLHIELRNWADLFCIVPLDANTLGKLANGLCDNLLTCVARAWNPYLMESLIVFPAMNTCMWEHPATQTQLATLKKWKLQIIDPVSKVLACGDTGIGGLPAPTAVAQTLLEHMKNYKNRLHSPNSF